MVQSYLFIFAILSCLIKSQVNGNINDSKKVESTRPNIWENKHNNFNFNFVVKQFENSFKEFKMVAKMEIDEISLAKDDLRLRSAVATDKNYRMENMIQSMIEETRKKAVDLKKMSFCIRQKVTEAVKDADEGIVEVRKCVQKSVDSATSKIKPIINKLEDHAVKLTDIAAKVALNVWECRKNENHTTCIRKALVEGEKLATAEANGIRLNLSQARLSWKSLIKELRLCFISGMEQGTVLEKELKLEILECIA